MKVEIDNIPILKNILARQGRRNEYFEGQPLILVSRQRLCDLVHMAQIKARLAACSAAPAYANLI